MQLLYFFKIVSSRGAEAKKRFSKLENQFLLSRNDDAGAIWKMIDAFEAETAAGGGRPLSALKKFVSKKIKEVCYQEYELIIYCLQSETLFTAVLNRSTKAM